MQQNTWAVPEAQPGQEGWWPWPLRQPDGDFFDVIVVRDTDKAGVGARGTLHRRSKTWSAHTGSEMPAYEVHFLRPMGYLKMDQRDIMPLDEGLYLATVGVR